jgi:hypothetical protein
MKKDIHPVDVLKSSIQWILHHRKTVVVIALSYLGLDKILEDMAFYTISYGTYTGSAKEFLATLTVDALVYLGMMFFLYVWVCVVSITLDNRPLTMNAISLYLRRNTAGVVVAIGIIVIAGLVGNLVYQLILEWIDLDALLTVVIALVYGGIGILFSMMPHELMINNQSGFKAFKNSLKKTSHYFGKLFSLVLMITMIYLIDMAIIDWLLKSFMNRAFNALNNYLYIGILATSITIFYHKIIRDDA